MTTIVVDREAGFMAADMQATAGNRRIKVKKIRTINGCLIGGAGILSDMERFWQAMDAGKKKVPAFDETDMVLLRPDKTMFLFESGVRMEIEDRYLALGTGGDIAISYLKDGLSPEDAIKKATGEDIYTGFEVQVEYL